MIDAMNVWASFLMPNPKSAKKRKEAQRIRDKDKGLFRWEVSVTPEEKAKLQQHLKEMRKTK